MVTNLTRNLLIGGGIIAAGGAYWLYKGSLSDDILDSEIPIGADSFGDDSIPLDLSYINSEWLKAKTSKPALFGGIPSLSTRETGTSRLVVVLGTPGVRIGYDSKAYSGSRLASHFAVGQVVSASKANKIMRWSAIDGPPTAYKPGSGDTVDGGFVDYMNQGENVAYIKKQLSSDPTTALFGPSMPYPITKSWEAIEDLLFGHGFVKLQAPGIQPIVSDSRSEGDYLVVVKPTARAWVNQKWLYPKGMWKWTGDGPVAKECSVLQARIRSADKLKDCDKLYYATQFHRVLSGPLTWGDVSSTITLREHATSTVIIKPVSSLMVTDRRYFKTSLSKALRHICRSHKILGTLNPAAASLALYVQDLGCKGAQYFT